MNEALASLCPKVKAQAESQAPPLAAPPCTHEDWKDGIHKEANGETTFYTRERRFVLRITEDPVRMPVWIFESNRPQPSKKQ